MLPTSKGNQTKDNLLDGWKEIAGYLGKEPRTCLRWEKTHGLPVHRMDTGSPRSKVFAFKTEIDDWLSSRKCSRNPPLFRRETLAGSRLIAAGILLGAVLISGTLIFLQLTGKKSIPAPEKPSLVILPIVDPAASEDLGPYYTEGLVNGIRDGIGGMEGFRILPSLSAAEAPAAGIYQTDHPAAPSVDYVLKLNALPGPELVRILFKLYHAGSHELVLEKEYQRRPEEYFRLRNDICRELIQLAGLDQQPMSGSEAIPSPLGLRSDYPSSGAEPAFEQESPRDILTLLDKGRTYARRCERTSNERAIALFGRIIKIDDRFAQAYLELARCYFNNVNLGWNTDRIWIDTAESLIDKAWALEPGLPDAYALRSRIVLLREVAFGEEGKEKALAIAREGLRKYPHHRDLHSQIGFYHYLKFAETGNPKSLDLAYEHKQKAFWADISDLQNITFIEILALQGRFATALELGEMLAETDATGIARFRLGEVYYYMDDPLRSRAVFQEITKSDLDLDIKIDANLYLGMIAARLGRVSEATRITDMILDSALDISVLEERRKLASISFGLGLREDGYRLLESFFSEEGYRRRRHLYLKYIDLDRNFDSVKHDKRFLRITAQMEESHDR